MTIDFSDFLDRLNWSGKGLAEAMNKKGGVGLALGLLVSRELLERSGEIYGQEAAQLIHRESVERLLAKIASGDLILQDQIMTGDPFDPQLNETFREIAITYLEDTDTHDERS